MTNPQIEIAKLLLEIKAVTLSPSKPYTYTSGLRSPIYCDNRLIISYPAQRKQIIQAFLALIKKNDLHFDVVAGIATASISHAAWIADALDKPMVYVRGQSKEHGKKNQIEGLIKKNQVALLIEDHVSTGGSSVAAGLALREAGAIVNDCVSISTYALKKSEDTFKQAHIHLHSLTNLTALLEVALKENVINENDKNVVLKWQDNPAAWSESQLALQNT